MIYSHIYTIIHKFGKTHKHHVFASHPQHNHLIIIVKYNATMTRLKFVTVPTLNRTHNSSLYACGTDSTFGSSHEQGPNLCEPRAPTQGLGQATSLHYELVDMPLSQHNTYDVCHEKWNISPLWLHITLNNNRCKITPLTVIKNIFWMHQKITHISDHTSHQ